ncbi:MAG: hypothetical protein DDT22_00246 [candidate division WS2 bacterium]|nr:hypothetical protein [Bacillota bacterium]MBT9174586.1 hypothetical protein [Candidatus Lithacetigena glycinireducens]
MTKKELKRTAQKYCDALRERMNQNIEKFETDWNDSHVWALALMIQDNPHEKVKRALREIKKSQTYYELSL